MRRLTNITTPHQNETQINVLITMNKHKQIRSLIMKQTIIRQINITTYTKVSTNNTITITHNVQITRAITTTTTTHIIIILRMTQLTIHIIPITKQRTTHNNNANHRKIKATTEYHCYTNTTQLRLNNVIHKTKNIHTNHTST